LYYYYKLPWRFEDYINFGQAIFPDEKDAQAVLDAVILEFDMLTAASV